MVKFEVQSNKTAINKPQKEYFTYYILYLKNTLQFDYVIIFLTVNQIIFDHCQSYTITCLTFQIIA